MKWLMLALALAAPAAAKKKKKAPPPPPATAAVDAAIKDLLDAEQQRIADCVVADAPQGAWALTVKATVKVNSAAQVMAADVTFEPARAETTRACVEKVLRGITYPKSAAPLTTISREWSFAMK